MTLSEETCPLKQMQPSTFYRGRNGQANASIQRDVTDETSSCLPVSLKNSHLPLCDTPHGNSSPQHKGCEKYNMKRKNHSPIIAHNTTHKRRRVANETTKDVGGCRVHMSAKRGFHLQFKFSPSRSPSFAKQKQRDKSLTMKKPAKKIVRDKGLNERPSNGVLHSESSTHYDMPANLVKESRLVDRCPDSDDESFESFRVDDDYTNIESPTPSNSSASTHGSVPECSSSLIALNGSDHSALSGIQSQLPPIHLEENTMGGSAFLASAKDDEKNVAQDNHGSLSSQAESIKENIEPDGSQDMFLSDSTPDKVNKSPQDNQPNSEVDVQSAPSTHGSESGSPSIGQPTVNLTRLTMKGGRFLPTPNRSPRGRVLPIREVRRLQRANAEMPGKEQMILDVGQKLIGAIQCSSCGMIYTAKSPVDEAQHSKFHSRVFTSLKFPGWKKETVLQKYSDGSRILQVYPNDLTHVQKKVAEVVSLVDQDLGFVETSQPVSQRNRKIFFHISRDRISGVCIADSINKAYRVLSSDSQAETSSSQRAVCCSSEPETAVCGISRIWVAMSERRKGLATRLVDCVRQHWIFGTLLRKEDVAFSDPTPSGRHFAESYFGTELFLTYNYSCR